MTSPAFDSVLSPREIAEVFGTPAIVQAMFDFEAALARAQAAEGLIPAEAAQQIAGVCRAELYDLNAIVAASARAGSLAIPLVKELQQTVALFDADAAGYVHWGSTSQDVIDTAMVLATRRALGLLDGALARLCDALLALAATHADDARPAPVLARTLMQPAAVTSFGLKCAQWLAPLVRTRARLRETAARALALQLGGAVGTLSVLGAAGPAVARRMADALQLALPPSPWHTQRDEWVRLGLEVAVCTGSLGKIATDLALMAQGEIGELAEPAVGKDGAGRGGSSAMPHKRNPVSAMLALAAAQRAPHRAAALLGAMGQQHERGLGNWQAELAEWPGLFTGSYGAASALADAFGALDVDTARMRRNIDALDGLVFAEAAAAQLAAVIGKQRAQALLEPLARRAVAEKRPLDVLVHDAVQGDAVLRARVDAAALRAAFDPVAAARWAAAQARRQCAALHATLGALPAAPWPPSPTPDA